MLTFLKIGGSLITDKSQPETPRLEVMERVAGEIRLALEQQPSLQLIIGHGSGSFGHVLAKQYATHLGVESADQWRGFAKVALIAARLNYLFADSLDRAGVPIFRIQPSASAICDAQKLREMAVKPIARTLDAGLVPLVYGDVAIDSAQGGAIISTEEVFSYLAMRLKPSRMLLAGDYAGVFDSNGQVVREITPASLNQVASALGGSAHTDVTGGMAAKVSAMLDLCRAIPGLSVRIFSGDQPSMIVQALINEHYDDGTQIHAPL